jgi:two-component system OmpR family sensor kinase
MTVKTRITLFIAGAGFIASLLFSVVVFFELIEQPFKLLDNVLKEEARRTTRMIVKRRIESESVSLDSDSHEMYAYWIEVHEQGTHRMLYQSALAKSVNLSPVNPGSSAIENAVIPPGQTGVGRNQSHEMTFRVRTFLFTLEGKRFMAQIARPMEKLKEEIRELALGVVSGLIFSTLALFAISRFMAGKILQPIGAMKDLAQDISEKNLDQRIPAGKGKDEFSDLARTINRMFDRLQHSFAKQKRFLADASHDLKTPLTMLRLTMDEVLSQNREDLPDFLRESLLRQHVQVLRMERLVKNLLDLSSLEISENIKSERVDLTNLVGSLLEDYGPLADTRNIRLRVQVPENLAIKGDPEKITRALSNILDNAVKYNLDGGEIHLDAETTDTTVTLHITNTGAGIPEYEIEKVFDQFYRVEGSRSSQYGGSGLGLAIVKRIIELHGGSVKMESKPGAWTKISIRFANPYSTQARS